MKIAVLIWGLIFLQSKLLMAQTLVPSVSQGATANQITLTIPLNVTLSGAPAPTFSAYFEKVGSAKQNFVIHDAFVNANHSAIVASGFIPPEITGGKYLLKGIFFQGQLDEGSFIQANCSEWNRSRKLSCYDNGKLLPDQYDMTVLMVDNKRPIINWNPTDYLDSLSVKAQVTKNETGDQTVTIIVSGSKLIFEYFTHAVSIIDPEGTSGYYNHLAYFGPQSLSFPDQEHKQVQISHTFASELGSPRVTPDLVGGLVSSINGRNSSGQPVFLSCNFQTGMYEFTNYDFHLGDVTATEVPCAYVEEL